MKRSGFPRPRLCFGQDASVTSEAQTSYRFCIFSVVVAARFGILTARSLELEAVLGVGADVGMLVHRFF